MTTVRRLLLLPAFLLGVLTVFQLALILGAPLGQAAWGGRYTVLPTFLRVSSMWSIGIYIFIFWVLRKRLTAPVSPFARRATIIIAIYFSIGVLLNFASPSIWEKSIMTPVAALLAYSVWRISRHHPTT